MRYAVRQALDNEYRNEVTRKKPSLTNTPTSASSYKSGKNRTTGTTDTEEGNKGEEDMGGKRDFFGRIISDSSSHGRMADEEKGKNEVLRNERRIYVTFHEGYSNAVRKPISMGELLAGL